MSTENGTTPFALNLNPAEAEERSQRSLYQVKEARYAPASDDYMAHTADPSGQRPIQLQIDWLGIDFRFSNQDNPNEPPLIPKGINVTDKNGAPMNWGTRDPEIDPDKDSYPIQYSKAFAKLGIILESDPHILDGRFFWCELRTVQSGKANPLKGVIWPVEVYTGPIPWQGTPRIIQSREGGAAGHPAQAAAAAAKPQVSDTEAELNFAKAMVGHAEGEIVDVGIPALTDSPNVLGEVARGGGKAILEKYGDFASGTFQLTVAATA